jgi:histone acetyltransferase 1
MYNTLTKPSNVQEFTVEDPNEAFDDLRDLCDLLYLRANDPDFAALRINTNIPADKLRSETSLPVDLIVPVETRNAIMKRTKIMQRQFDRLVEMHLLSFIPHANRSRARVTRREQTTNLRDKEFYFWRLYVKQRLYIFNRDQLAQLERQERIEKLESALDSVQEAYGIMLERLEKRERDLKYGTLFGIKESEEDPMAVEGAMKVRAKRKIVDDEEDDEEMVDAGVNGHGRKKAKA